MTTMHKSGLVWLPRLLAAAAAVLITACSGAAEQNQPPADLKCGKPTREDLVASYVDGLNGEDREALRSLVDGYGLDLDSTARSKIDVAIDQRLAAFGGKSIVMQREHFADTVPYVSSAQLKGTMSSGDYLEQIPLRKPQGRANWCLSIHDVPLLTSPVFPTTP